MNSATQLLPCQSFISCFMCFSTWLCISCLYTFLSKCKCQNIILLLLWPISAGILSFTLRKWGQIHICYWERLLHIIGDPVHHSVFLWKKKHPQNHTQSKAIGRNSLCKVMVFSTSHGGSWCLFCSKIMLLKDTCETAGQIGRNAPFRSEKSLQLQWGQHLRIQEQTFL